MSTRDELAALMKDRLREVYMTATVERYDAAFIMDDDPLNDVVVDGHVDFIDLADAILARWRLVPVDDAASALRDAHTGLPPRIELTEEESDEFTAALQWDTPSPSYRPGCDHPNVKTTQFCPDCGTFVMVSQR